WVKNFTGIESKKLQTELVSWDGLIYNKEELGTPAPNGNYFLRIKALKMFGDINNEIDYKSW
ncbi:10002_t:CDS:1, partial [Funneliformis caledonium]